MAKPKRELSRWVWPSTETVIRYKRETTAIACEVFRNY
jgi:hypothetical protein